MSVRDGHVDDPFGSGACWDVFRSWLRARMARMIRGLEIGVEARDLRRIVGSGFRYNAGRMDYK